MKGVIKTCEANITFLKESYVKILKKCTLPLTAPGQVNMIITEMGVMEITPEGIVLTEINPEFTVEQVQAATEATLIISPNLKNML